jgi:hypothetical protein
MLLMKWLFGRTHFSLTGDPLNGGGGASDDQPATDDTGNDDLGDGGSTDTTPTEEIAFKGAKVSKSELENWAKETYKDRFEAFENREKWQAENTRKAQENAEKLRKAELYDRLMAEERYGQRQRPTNPYEAKKKEYVEKKTKHFPDVDPRFFESQFDDIQELAEMKGRELVQPIYEQSGDRFEREFLAAHPKVIKGSEEYQKIARLMGAGVEPEEAYQTVFYKDLMAEQLKAETEKAIKARDEEAKRKLKQTRQSSSQTGTKPKSKNFEEHAWNVIRQMKGA